MLDQFYPIVLAVHNLWRWIALFGVLATTVVSLRGVRADAAGRPPASERIATIAVIVLDVQVFLGLALYAGLSPLTRSMWTSPGAAPPGGSRASSCC